MTIPIIIQKFGSFVNVTKCPENDVWHIFHLPHLRATLVLVLEWLINRPNLPDSSVTSTHQDLPRCLNWKTIEPLSSRYDSSHSTPCFSVMSSPCSSSRFFLMFFPFNCAQFLLLSRYLKRIVRSLLPWKLSHLQNFKSFYWYITVCSHDILSNINQPTNPTAPPPPPP